MKENNQTKKEMTIDDLALILAKRFDEMDEKIDKGFKEVRDELKGEIKSSTEDIKAELNKKVDKIDHNTLDYRVERLEKKFA